MANIRCFDSTNTKILTASESSSEKKQQTIFKEIQSNLKRLNTVTPIKNNGIIYNNITINSTCDISSGTVQFSESYALLADVRAGAGLCFPVQISTPFNTVQNTLCLNLCNNTFNTGFQDAITGL
jgi:hypothetical protein